MPFWTKKSEEEEKISTSAPSDKDIKSTEVKAATTQTTKSAPIIESAKPPVSEASSAVISSIDDILNQKYGKVRSALGAGTVIQGKLSFDTPVRIDGKLSGEIFSSKALIVGPTGQIDAKVEVSCLVVLGSVKGNVKATDRIELLAGANLEGQVKTPTLVIESGARFRGDCDMGTKSKVVAHEAENRKQADTNIITDPNIDLGSVLAATDSAKTEVSKLESGEVEVIKDQPSVH